MAQLSDDCFAFGGNLLSLAAAQAGLRQAAKQFSGEEVLSLPQLAGRILSRPVIAARSVPPFLNSAVDGYAYAHGDGAELQITTTIAAGADLPEPLPLQSAARILTGAPLPPNADTVLMDEDAEIADGRVRIPTELKAGSNARPKGEDMREGETLYPAGHNLTRLDLARLAAGGVEEAWVRPALKVHVLSSGDEIKSGQVADANRWILQAVFPAPTFEVTFAGVVGDDLAETEAALAQIDADLILTSGGVSVGERDVLRQAIEALGTLEFWRVGIKPGRPVAFGNLGDTPIFGLPGNPVACFITALFLAKPYALAMLGAEMPDLTFPVRLSRDYRKKARRTEFVRVHLDKDGMALPYAVAGAGVISSLTQTDGLLVLGDDLTQVDQGTSVPFLPFRGLLT